MNGIDPPLYDVTAGGTNPFAKRSRIITENRPPSNSGKPLPRTGRARGTLASTARPQIAASSACRLKGLVPGVPTTHSPSRASGGEAGLRSSKRPMSRY